MEGMKEGAVFGLGNPLLDITAYVDDEFLQKYNLPKNSAILAGPQHEGLYEDLINKYEIDYTAGGATQNTVRFMQWMLGKNNANIATFMGCIGNDYFGKMMERKAKSDGVNVKYAVDEEQSTGTCAVLITDKGANRSLCAYLGASNKFTKEDLIKNFYLAEKARIYYTTGHHLAVCHAAAMELARHAHSWGKDFFLNLGAPYVSQKCSKELAEIVPFVDYFFSNSDEAKSYATMKGWKNDDLKQVAKLISEEAKEKYSNPKIPNEFKRGRIVVITQEEKPVLVARTGQKSVDEYPVTQVVKEKIIDTNGAGDAFTGGFLAMYVQNKPFETCMKAAIYCATECIQLSGCAFPKENKFKP